MKHHTLIRNLLLLLTLVTMASCRTKQQATDIDYRALVRAADKLGFDIEEHDNHTLMLEAASWVGTPYKYGGNTRTGVDCSGLTCAIYDKVYRLQLPRRSIDQYNSSLRMAVSQEHLQQGDLLFFSSPNSQGRCAHVGIHLKNHKFIHASSTRGVVIDNITGRYWQKHFIGIGRKQ